jgi:hypothetical protein
MRHNGVVTLIPDEAEVADALRDAGALARLKTLALTGDLVQHPDQLDAVSTGLSPQSRVALASHIHVVVSEGWGTT